MDRIRDVRPPGSPHAAYRNAPQVVDRMLSNAVAGPNSCLIWAGRTDRDNYGMTQVDSKTLRAHRVVYALLVEPLSSTTFIDHTCHNQDQSCPGGRDCLHRRCINPHHLEPVTNRENLLRSARSIAGANARKTHCTRGHPFNAENTYVLSNGGRRCRACTKARNAARS
ncbi:hypothetical protein [Streptomyces sp. NPDC096153]|uniref:hypothetical protein n=1 Tax=Streptomyces sp. NPDC096153 TaxID=3155548 RepID=UPI00332966DD